MKRVLVTGGTGFIGRALVQQLVTRGDQVTVFSRDAKAARAQLHRDARVVVWNPEKSGPWEAELAVVDAVVHLAGAPVAKRWTEAHKQRILSSRVGATHALVEAIGKHDKRPAVLVSASATGYYGADRPGAELDEESEPGSDFLAEVCTKWEHEAEAAEELGLRTVVLRIGVVIGAGGGALAQMVQLGGAFVGGPVGKGQNELSWIHVDDVVGMILMALDDDSLRGAVNCTSPFVCTQRELAEKAGSVLGRPHIGVPAAAARLMLGGAVDVLVGSLHVQPKRALELGYEYHHARLVPALEASLIND